MNSPFDHLVKHATQPAAPSEPPPDKRPGQTFKLLELINRQPDISTEELSKQSGVCSQQIWTKLQRHLARGHVFHEASGWRMSPDAPQLREVHQAITLLKKHGFSVQEPAPHFDPALFQGKGAILVGEPVRRNDPLSALAIRILVETGHVSQADADSAFTLACEALEDEAQRMNVTLPWVVRNVRPVPEDVQRDANRYRAINTPEIADFLSAMHNEALHQRERWGSDHDAGKTDADWFWLIDHLAGKAVRAQADEKRLHHIITTAAACLNWHAARVGAWASMRPGIAPVEQGAAGQGSGRVDCGECPNVTSGCESGHCMKAKGGEA